MYVHIKSIGDRSYIIKAMFYLCLKVQPDINISNIHMSEALISFQYYFLKLIYLIQLDAQVLLLRILKNRNRILFRVTTGGSPNHPRQL